MRRRIIGTIVGVLAGALFLGAAVHASVTGGGSASPRTKITLVAPAAPGGG